MKIEEVPAVTRSTWRNPSKKHTAKISLLVPNPRIAEVNARPDVEVVVEIAPGETALIPSQYDHAIVNVKGDRVVGGLCPWLARIDPPEQWARGDLFAVPDAVRAPVLATSRANTTTGAPRRKLED